MSIFQKLNSNIGDAELYHKLKSGYVLASVEKKDGTSSLRLMTAEPNSVGALMGTRVTNEDKGKAKRKHWTDGLTTEEKDAKYISNEKPVYVADAIRSGQKGASVYLNKVLRGDKVGDLPNLIFIEKNTLESHPQYKNLVSGRLDILNFLEGKEELREEVTSEKVKALFKALEKDVFFGTFRKKSGEVRHMVMTRNADVVNALSPGAYESGLEIDINTEDGKAKMLKVLDSGIIPVFDLEKQDLRVYNLGSKVDVEGLPSLKVLDKEDALSFAVGDITLGELVKGSRVKRKVDAKGKEGIDLQAQIIELVNTNVPLDDTWTYRLNKLKVAVKENLVKEIGAVNSELASGIKLNEYKNGKVLQLIIPKANINIFVSPKGVLDVSGEKYNYQFKTNPGLGTDSGLGGIKAQQERYVHNKVALGEFKAMVLYYILETFKKRVKVKDLVFMNDAFIPKK